MTQVRKQKPLSFDDAALPPILEADDDVRNWQDAKVAAGLKQADEGRFADADKVSAVLRKYIPNG